MKAIALFLLLLPSFAFAEQVRLSAGMDVREVARTIELLGGVDITGQLSVVGANGDWPLRGSHWSFADYQVVIEIVQKRSALASIHYWSASDFGHSLQRREETKVTVIEIAFDTDTKTVVSGERSRKTEKKKAEPGATDNPDGA